MKPWPVRFYVDADTLGLAHLLVAVRTDVTYPGFQGKTVGGRDMPACPITDTETDDDVWIPVVAQAGWTIITRDQAIQRRTAEKIAVAASKAKMFAITAPGQLRNWDMLRITLRHWDAIEASIGENGPYIYKMTLTTLEQIEL